MRGGVSKNPALCGVLFMSSPHAWGCFEETAKLDQLIRVFPTCVGVFPQRAGRSPACPRLPHLRGGVSGARTRAAVRWASSPHAWGCFQLREEVRIVRHVFPTCVGVFPGWPYRSGMCRCLPHMRGGVSHQDYSVRTARQSSPHAWGCFPYSAALQVIRLVFPTCVGVFPGLTRCILTRTRLPHMRGGVSYVCGAGEG